MKEFLMPSLGADMEDGTLVEWRKQPGDAVNRGDIIAEVDTQKGLIEIEVFDDGFIGELLIKEGEKVPVGTPMALIKTGQPKAEQEKEQVVETKTPSEEKKILQPTEEHLAGTNVPKEPSQKRIKVSPLARRIAEENQIDLSEITGSGENGAITKDDVNKAIEQKGISKPEEKPEEKLPEKKPEEKLPEKKPEKVTDTGEGIRMAVAAAMSKSNREIPHYYLDKKIDMSKALAWLKETNKERSVKERLLTVVLLVKAVAKSLDEVPQLNATWENGLHIKNEINIGFVVSLKSGGVIVPSINNTDLKNLSQIMETLNDLIPRARAMKLRSSELGNSTITLTSLGEGGADSVLGVIYPPQVAVIGFGGIKEEAWVENGMLGIRPVITASLAGDHRANDGLTGSRFLNILEENLQNPEAL